MMDDGLFMGGLYRGVVAMVPAVVLAVVIFDRMVPGVRVSGFSRRFDRRIVVMGGVGGMIVMRRMVVVAVVGDFGRRVAMVVVAVFGGLMVVGIMRFGRVVRLVRAVCVVGLVFVAHVTPVPQPLTTVFDRETGIT